MIVADTSLVAHLFNKTILTEMAQEILRRDDYWILPSLWQEEYANVLSKLARKEETPINDVIKRFDHTVAELEGDEVIVDIRKALQLSIKYKISVYDAHFIALAIDFQTVVITEDKELSKKCPDYAMSMWSFLNGLDSA